MSLMAVTADSLSRDLGEKVPDEYVVIAKHSVLGMDSESVTDVLGCTVEEIQEIERDDLYKKVRVQIGMVHAQSKVDQTTGWDQLEELAIRKLAERMPHERDPEFILRVAAVANKAQRRQGQQPNGFLDPTKQNGRTAIVLTQRLVQRITRAGEEQVEERQLSIHDGSMRHPTFAEIDDVLSVSRRPALSQRVEISTHTADPTFEELDEAMRDRGF